MRACYFTIVSLGFRSCEVYGGYSVNIIGRKEGRREGRKGGREGKREKMNEPINTLSLG